MAGGRIGGGAHRANGNSDDVKSKEVRDTHSHTHTHETFGGCRYGIMRNARYRLPGRVCFWSSVARAGCVCVDAVRVYIHGAESVRTVWCNVVFCKEDELRVKGVVRAELVGLMNHVAVR